MAVLNDGTKQFDHQNDGTTQLLSGCLRDFRNKPFPTRARIEYYNNVLTVLFHNGMTNNNDDYEMCLRADGVQLPKNGYFGLSAATGGLADDHDVFHFLTTSLHPVAQAADPAKVPENSEKLKQEYKEYQEKLDKQKKEYKDKHPDEAKDEDEWEEFYESENQRELRQIWQGQSQIFEHLRDLSRKVDEVIGRQENTLSLVSRNLAATSGGQLPPQAVGQLPVGGGSVQFGSSITRPEVDMLITNQNLLLTTVRDIKNIADTVLQNQQRAPTAQIQASGYDVQSLVAEMRDGMNQVKQGMAHVGQKLSSPQASAQTVCPTGNCIGVTLFLSVSAVQLLLVILYNVFKSRSEAQAKKFY